MLTPNAQLKALQDNGQLTELIVMQEAVKTLPFGDVWNEYCARTNCPDDFNLFSEIKAYEEQVLVKRV